VIISFFLFVSYHDLKKLPLFRSIISTPTHVESSPSATDPSPLPAPAH